MAFFIRALRKRESEKGRDNLRSKVTRDKQIISIHLCEYCFRIIVEVNITKTLWTSEKRVAGWPGWLQLRCGDWALRVSVRPVQ